MKFEISVNDHSITKNVENLVRMLFETISNEIHELSQDKEQSRGIL